MKKSLLAVSSFAVLAAFSPQAFADEKDDRIAALETQLQTLAAEVQDLKQSRIEEKASLNEKISDAAEQAAAKAVQAIEPGAGDAKSDVKVTMNPSPKFESGDFSWQPFGRVQLDYAAFADDKADHPNGAAFRRARLGMKGTVAKDFGYKAEIDFANEAVNFRDVYINYTGFDHGEIRVGNFKPGFALEELTSANYTTFGEVAAPTSAFATGEIIGAGGLFGGDQWSASAGLFNDDASRNSTDDEAWSAVGRVSYAPVNDEEKTVHVGASYSYRTPDQATDTFTVRAKAENAIQSAYAVQASVTDAESAGLYGLEGAFVYGPLSAQGEYYGYGIARNDGNDDVDFSGGYGQISYILTGERRPYEAKSGTFGRVVPKNPLDPAAGHWGAWELAGRYSELDLTDGAVTGGTMTNYTAGVNWYLNKYARLTANYIDVHTDENAVTPHDDPQVFLARAQLDF